MQITLARKEAPSCLFSRCQLCMHAAVLRAVFAREKHLSALRFQLCMHAARLEATPGREEHSHPSCIGSWTEARGGTMQAHQAGNAKGGTVAVQGELGGGSEALERGL